MLDKYILGGLLFCKFELVLGSYFDKTNSANKDKWSLKKLQKQMSCLISILQALLPRRRIFSLFEGLVDQRGVVWMEANWQKGEKWGKERPGRKLHCTADAFEG